MNRLELYFHTVNSTNDYLKENYLDLPMPTIIRADYQRFGRGQFDRVWSSKPSENLLCSILLKDILLSELDSIQSHLIKILLSLLKTYGLEATYKKPNDIYVKDSKLCGILTETKVNNNRYDYVIIGIGLNINQKDFGNLNATSLALLNGIDYDIQTVYDHLLSNLFHD